MREDDGDGRGETLGLTETLALGEALLLLLVLPLPLPLPDGVGGTPVPDEVPLTMVVPVLDAAGDVAAGVTDDEGDPVRAGRDALGVLLDDTEAGRLGELGGVPLGVGGVQSLVHNSLTR